MTEWLDASAKISAQRGGGAIATGTDRQSVPVSLVARAGLTALVLLAWGSSAESFDQGPAQPRSKQSRDIRIDDDVRLGRVEGGQYIATPDALDVRGQATIGGRLDVNAPTQAHSITGSYWTQSARGLYTSDTDKPANWLGNGAGGSASQYAYGGFGQGIFLSGIGDVGVVGAVRTTDIRTSGRLPIGVMGWCFNFKVEAPQTCWGGYFEARRKVGAGQIHGIEVNVTDLGNGSDRIVPSAMSSGPNAVYASWASGFNIVAGGNVRPGQQKGWDGTKAVTQASDVGAALPIYANGAKFEKGIIISENAIVGCDGSGYPNVCTGLEMGRGTRIGWIDGSTRMGAVIDSNVSPSGPGLRQSFTDGGIVFDGYGSPTFTIVGRKSDGVGLQVSGGSDGGAARLAATGSPNASLALAGSGTGTVQLQSLLQMKPVLTAALPACTPPLRGSLAVVSDAARATDRGPLVGGGTGELALVLCGISGWIVR